MERLKSWAHRLAMLALLSVLLFGLAYSFPADLALLMAADLSLYVEAVVTVFVVAQVTKVRPILSMARLWMMAAYGRVLGHTAPRTSRSGSRRKPSAINDDGDGAGAFALAA